MAKYEYECGRCGRVRDVLKPIAEMDRGEYCLNCGKHMDRILRAPAAAIVYGGTGAGRGNAQARRDMRWNEACNRDQHDPYIQATAQMEHSYHEQKDIGLDVAKPTEAGRQEAAKRIAKQ